MIQKITIPVVVTRTGAIRHGYFSCDGGGKNPHMDHEVALDFFEEEDYKTGYAVVHVEAEIDVDAVFKEQKAVGTVSPPVEVNESPAILE